MPRRKHDWPAVALALAERIPQDRLHPRTVAWVEAHQRSRRPWAVAFSGGADSLALLLLVWAHWPERRAKLLALHFNHRLRGRAAVGDAQFSGKVAGGLGVKIRVGRWENPPASPNEAQARTARLHFFAEELKRSRAAALWFGHQQDDVAETLLMRLARGSGTAGLAAPRPVQGRPDGADTLRPLLTLPKVLIAEALREAGAEWREDESNQSARHFRNRLRNSVIPGWVTAAGRDALAGAALSRERLEEDDDALEQWLTQLDAVEPDGALNLTALAGKPVALWRRALHRWLLGQPRANDLSRHGFDDLLSKLRAGVTTRFSLGADGFARIRAGRLRFETRARNRVGRPR